MVLPTDKGQAVRTVAKYKLFPQRRDLGTVKMIIKDIRGMPDKYLVINS